MIALFTDFGPDSPYTGQMEAVLHCSSPAAKVLRLCSDAPGFDARASAYLLAAYASAGFPPGTVFLSVVDPGVGGSRRAVAVEADQCWFIGPDNGLFNMVTRRATVCTWWEITWQANVLSPTFQGRDLFAPVAARLSRGKPLPGKPVKIKPEILAADWPNDLFEVIYIDHFGNAITGICGSSMDATSIFSIGKRRIAHADTFQSVREGEIFWYVNSNGLVEIAACRGSASHIMALSIGSSVRMRKQSRQMRG